MAPARFVRAFSPSRLIRSLCNSAALRAAAALGLSGLALACGNLMLARVLAPAEFARFALFFAIAQIGMSIGPFGADVIMTRRHYDPGPELHRRVLTTSLIVAVVLVIVSKLAYPLSNALLAVMLVTIAAGGVKVVATSHFRSQERFGAALLLTISTNAALLVASSVAYGMHAETALLPAGAMATSVCLTSWLGWRAVAAQRGAAAPARTVYPLSEAWSAVNFTGAGMILSSLERVITPGLLGLPALATFSVLATIAGSPFQMLHQGIGYTLVPGLRNAPDQAARRRVLAHECVTAAAICIGAGVLVWWLTPYILHVVLADRYVIAWPLLLVIIGLGCLKVIGSVAAATVNALGSSADLARLSQAGWLSIGLALAAGWWGSKWGLTGLVAGVALGWLARAWVVGRIAARHFAAARERGLSPAAAPGLD
jgi:O-antigen/teichoic acid export membrane protein